MESCCDTDFYQWTKQQASLIRDGVIASLDLVNLAEEIESMSRREHRALRSHIFIVMMHLLNWKYQPEQRSMSWERSIRNAHRKIKDLLGDSPSLKQEILSLITQKNISMPDEDASQETGIDIGVFPVDCIFSVDHVLNNYWPD